MAESCGGIEQEEEGQGRHREMERDAFQSVIPNVIHRTDAQINAM